MLARKHALETLATIGQSHVPTRCAIDLDTGHANLDGVDWTGSPAGVAFPAVPWFLENWRKEKITGIHVSRRSLDYVVPELCLHRIGNISHFHGVHCIFERLDHLPPAEEPEVAALLF